MDQTSRTPGSSVILFFGKVVEYKKVKADFRTFVLKKYKKTIILQEKVQVLHKYKG